MDVVSNDIADTVNEVYQAIKTVDCANNNNKTSTSIKSRKKKTKCTGEDMSKIDSKDVKKCKIDDEAKQTKKKRALEETENKSKTKSKKMCDKRDKPDKCDKKSGDEIVEKKCDESRCEEMAKLDDESGDESCKKRQKRENLSDEEKKVKKSSDESKIRRVHFAKINDNVISDFELIETRLLDKMIVAQDAEKKIRKPSPANVIVMAIRSIAKQGIPPNDGVMLHGYLHAKPSSLCGIDLHVYGTNDLHVSYATSLIDEKHGGFAVYVRNVSLVYKDIAIGDVIGYLELRGNDDLRISVS